MGVCQKVLLLVEPAVNGRGVQVNMFIKVVLPVAGDKKQSFDIFSSNCPPLLTKPQILPLPLPAAPSPSHWCHPAFTLLPLPVSPPLPPSTEPIIQLLEHENRLVITLPGTGEADEDDGKGWVLGGMKGVPVREGQGAGEKREWLVRLGWGVGYGLREPSMGEISIDIQVPLCISNKLILSTRGIFTTSTTSPHLSRSSSSASLTSPTSPSTVVHHPDMQQNIDSISATPKISWTPRSRTRYQAFLAGVVAPPPMNAWDVPDVIEANFPGTSVLTLTWSDPNRAARTRGKENIYGVGRKLPRELEDLPLIVKLGSCYSEVTLSPSPRPREEGLGIVYDVEVECSIADTSSRWAGPARTVVMSLDVPVDWAVMELEVKQKGRRGKRRLVVVQLDDPYVLALAEGDGDGVQRSPRKGMGLGGGLVARRRGREGSWDPVVGTPTRLGIKQGKKLESTAMSPAVMDKNSNRDQASLLRYPIPIPVGSVDCSFEQSMMEEDEEEDEEEVTMMLQEEGEVSMLQEQSFEELSTPTKTTFPVKGLFGVPVTPANEEKNVAAVRTPLSVKKGYDHSAIAASMMETSSFAFEIECEKEDASITLHIRGVLEPLEPEEQIDESKITQILVPCNRFPTSDAEHMYTVRTPEHCSPDYEMTYIVQNQTRPSIELGYMHVGVEKGEGERQPMVYVRPGRGDSPVLEFGPDFGRGDLSPERSRGSDVMTSRASDGSESRRRMDSEEVAIASEFGGSPLGETRRESLRLGSPINDLIELSPSLTTTSTSPVVPATTTSSIPGSDSGAFVDLISKAFTPTTSIFATESETPFSAVDVDRFSTTATVSPGPQDWPWTDGWNSRRVSELQAEHVEMGERDNDSVMADDEILEPSVPELPSRSWKWTVLQSLSSWKALIMYGMIVMFASYTLQAYWAELAGERAVEKLLREWQGEGGVRDWMATYAYTDLPEESIIFPNTTLAVPAPGPATTCHVSKRGDNGMKVVERLTQAVKEFERTFGVKINHPENTASAAKGGRRAWMEPLEEDRSRRIELFDAGALLARLPFMAKDTAQFIWDRLHQDLLPQIHQNLQDLDSWSMPYRVKVVEWAAPRQEKLGEALGDALERAKIEAKKRKAHLLKVSKSGWSTTWNKAQSLKERLQAQVQATL